MLCGTESGLTLEPGQNKGVTNACLTEPNSLGKDRRGRLRGFPDCRLDGLYAQMASLSDLTAETLEGSEINQEGIRGEREAGEFERRVVPSRPFWQAGPRQFQHKGTFVAWLSGQCSVCSWGVGA